jgi:hypothetical protein
MAKVMIRTKVLWCICCHDKHTTLLKLDEVRICRKCQELLSKTGEAPIVSGGKLMRSKENPNLIIYVPKEEENGDRKEVSANQVSGSGSDMPTPDKSGLPEHQSGSTD